MTMTRPRLIRIEPHVGIESKAWQLANEAVRSGIDDITVRIVGGALQDLDIREKDGTRHFYTVIDGGWYSLVRAEGGA